jgi:hypothetical protein
MVIAPPTSNVEILQESFLPLSIRPRLSELCETTLKHCQETAGHPFLFDDGDGSEHVKA